MRKAFRMLFLFSPLVFASPSSAKPEFLEVLVQTYKSQAAVLNERSCVTCHAGPGDFALNLYGRQIRAALAEANTKTLTEAILRKVEPLDANGDGRTNLQEIEASTAPGEVKPGSKAVTTQPEPPAPAKSLIPKNFFHPAIVHFPIALFIASLILDLLGLLRKSENLLRAGWYNLLFGAITAFGGLASGYIATLRMRVPISGLIQQHMILALIGTAIMWVLIALRAKRHEKMSPGFRIAYFVFGLAGLVLISWSGHLGGIFVYGE